MAVFSADTLHDLLVSALETAGCSPENANALARQTVLAEELGQKIVGVAHVFDYINDLAMGRIAGKAVPSVSKPAPTMILVDGNNGLPQLGFDLAYDDLVSTAHKLGLCAFLQKNTTLCGSLGTFALRVAEAGLVCLAATNGPAVITGSGATKPIYCTNPLAFSAPQADGPPLLIDQSSSATTFVNVRAASERGESIPSGWAIDRDGQPTTDAGAALKGALLPFGGARGANIALMVEVLAGGLPGAQWSLDSLSADQSDQCAGSGLFVLAMDPAPADSRFPIRMASQIKRLQQDYGVHIPGLSKAKLRHRASKDGIEVDDRLVARLHQIVS